MDYLHSSREAGWEKDCDDDSNNREILVQEEEAGCTRMIPRKCGVLASFLFVLRKSTRSCLWTDKAPISSNVESFANVAVITTHKAL